MKDITRQLLVLLVLASAAFAQEAGSDLDRSSPEATLFTFLDALNPPEGERADLDAALACMDFSGLDKLSREDRSLKVDLACRLKEIIDRTRLVKPGDLPWAGEDPFVFFRYGSGEIVLAMQDPERPLSPWLFSKKTIASIEDIFPEAMKRSRVAGSAQVPFHLSPSMWLRSLFPETLHAKGFLLEHWQWICLLALSILGILVERIVSGVIPATVLLILRRKRLEVGHTEARSGLRPFGILAMALFWWALVGWVGLPHKAHDVAVVAVRFLAAVAGVWAAYRLVDVFADILRRKAGETATKFDDLLVPLFRKSLKVFVTIVGLVFLASVLQIEVTSVLAGLGLGGLAFALAAKDTVQNLFGSLMIIFDRPFHVGDWVLIGKTEGTVVEVGFRSTRVRTFYNSLITIPNGSLISAVVDNMGARRYRRVKTMLSLTYDTPPERIEAFCEGVRELIRHHPYTRKDYFHVYFNKFSASSLDILLYAFFEVPDWGTELRERQRLFNDILRLAAALGIEFAPTQTIRLASPAEGEAGERAGATDRAEVDGALEAGRREARGIVGALLGDPVRIPPPVTAGRPEQDDRGESGEDDGGE